MVPLDAFLSRLLPSAPGAPDPLVRQSLVDAAIEFCEYTGAIRVTSDAVPSIYGVGTYDIDLPKDIELSRVIGVWLGKRKIPTAPEAAVHEVRAVLPTEPADVGAPRYCLVIEPKTLTFVPAPDEADLPIVIRSYTRPARDAKTLHDELFYRWGEAIVHGALYRLCGIPGQPFTDPMQVQTSQGRFFSALGRAKIDANRGTVVGAMGVKSRPFA